MRRRATSLAFSLATLLCLWSLDAIGQEGPGTSVCGDGSLDGDEWCDDDNTADGDGCSSDCECETDEYVTRLDDGTWVVHPVGVAPLNAQCDGPNIQAAIDAPREDDEDLRVISVSGTYSLGDGADNTPRRLIVVSGSRVRLNGPATFTGGGIVPFGAVIVSGDRLTIEQITLDQPSFAGFNVMPSGGVGLQSNRVVGLQHPDRYSETAMGIFGSGMTDFVDDEGVVTQSVIEGNQLGTAELDVGRGILLGESTGVRITENTVFSHFMGITLRNGQDNVVSLNTIIGCNCYYYLNPLSQGYDNGLSVYGNSRDNEFWGNAIENVANGILVKASAGDTFRSNSIHQTYPCVTEDGDPECFSTGINLIADWGAVRNCWLEDNELTGSVSFAQIYVAPAAESNAFIGNELAALAAMDTASVLVEGHGNTFDGNELDGPTLAFQVDGEGNELVGQEINDVSADALVINGDFNVVVGNEVTDVVGDGVVLNGDENRVLENELHEIDGAGVVILGEQNEVGDNEFADISGPHVDDRSALKAKGFDSIPRLRRVHRRVEPPWRAVSGGGRTRAGVSRQTPRDEGP